MIFLSYSREDRDQSTHIKNLVRNWGFEVYSDPQTTEGSPFWRNNIKKVWQDCELMLVLWSVNAAASPWVDQEIRGFNKNIAFIGLDETPVPTLHQHLILEENDLKSFLDSRLSPHPYYRKSIEKFDDSIAKKRSQKIEMYLNRLSSLEISDNPLLPEPLKENFWKGSDGSIVREIESPNKGLTLLLGIAPVTNAQFSEFLAKISWPVTKISYNPRFAYDNSPVVGVNWFEAMAYCKYHGATLPSVRDWETAARAGNTDSIYATNTGYISVENCNYNVPIAEGHPIDPRIFPPNPHGFYGMTGNTWDWCSDAVEKFRALKGGGYMDSENFCKISSMYRNLPIDRDCSVGFRIMFKFDENQLSNIRK